MKMFYVYFYKNGKEICHCFEYDEAQTKHFAKLVNGRIVVE